MDCNGVLHINFAESLTSSSTTMRFAFVSLIEMSQQLSDCLYLYCNEILFRHSFSHSEEEYCDQIISQKMAFRFKLYIVFSADYVKMIT